MPHARRTLSALAVVILAAGARLVAADPLFTLEDEGQTFLYRARPGDAPANVAEMFGVPPRDLPAFLAGNGITAPTRVGAGFVYRVPNTTARVLAERTAALERETTRLRRTVVEEKKHAQALVRAADDARAQAAQAEGHAARVARLEAVWPWAKAGIVLLVIAAGAAIYTAMAAVRRQAQSERYARALARELEEKRKAGLLERQEGARRVVELETRVRALEAQLGPRVVISGRGGS